MKQLISFTRLETTEFSSDLDIRLCLVCIFGTHLALVGNAAAILAFADGDAVLSSKCCEKICQLWLLKNNSTSSYFSP